MYTNVLYDAFHEEDHNREKHQLGDYAAAWAAKRLNEAARNQHVDVIKEEKQQKDNNEQQSPPFMDTTNQIVIVDLLKPLPYYLSTNQSYIYILGDIKARGKWLRKTSISWFHVLREGKIKTEAVHEKGAHGDGVPFNIKTHPP